VIRIVTPSLGFLLRVCSPDRGLLERNYIAWSVRQFVPDAPSVTNAVFLNNFMRAWGHTFVYDRETLAQSLQLAGFGAIRECEFGRSDHPFLSGLENAVRLPPGFLELESMIFEAVG
jgi:predicted SAM-dependent methyltransferase